MACGAAALWGTWPLYARSGAVEGLPLAFLTMCAMALPAPFVVKRAALADRGALLALIVVGVADAANAVLYFSALGRGPVVVATLTHYLAPLLVAVTSPWVLREVRSRRALLAAPVVLAGLGLVLWTSAGDGGDWRMTALFGAGSAGFYATLVLASRIAGRAWSPLGVTSVHAVVSVVALLLVFGRSALPEVTRGLGAVLVGCLVNGLFAAVLFNVALQRIGAQLTGVLTYLEPLTASLIGVVAFHEVAGWNTAVGAVLVLAAGAWVALEPAHPR